MNKHLLKAFALLLLSHSLYSQCTNIPVKEAVFNGDFEKGYPKSGKFSDNTTPSFYSDLTYAGDFTGNNCWNSIGDKWGIGKGEPASSQISCCSGSDYYNPYASCSYTVGPFADHTTGTKDGFALIADIYNLSSSSRSRNGNVVIWEQQVNIYPGQTYYFSSWLALFGNANPTPQLELDIIGVNGGVPDNANGKLVNITGGITNVKMQWNEFKTTWVNSNLYTQAIIRIQIKNSSPGAGATGLDFAVDDISFINSCQNTTSNVTYTIGFTPDSDNLCEIGGSRNLVIKDDNGNTVNPGGGKDIRWYSGGGSTQTEITANAGINNYTVNTVGTYRACVYDPVGNLGCAVSATYTATESVNVALSDLELCSPASYSLDCGMTAPNGAVSSVAWSGPSGSSSSKTYTVNKAGSHTLTVTGAAGHAGCNFTKSFNVTSKLPAAPTNLEYCDGGGTATTLTLGDSKKYKWSTSQTMTPLIGTGTSISWTPATGTTGDQILWMQSANTSTAGTMGGPNVNTSTADKTLTTDLKTYQSINIKSAMMGLEAWTGGCGAAGSGSGTATVELLDASNAVVATKSVSLPCGSASSVTLDMSVPAGNYHLRATSGGNLLTNPVWSGTGATYGVAGYVDITGYDKHQGAFGQMVIEKSDACDPIPVVIKAKSCCTPPADNPDIDMVTSVLTVCSPNKASVVSKTGLTNGLDYKWQVSHDNGTTWKDTLSSGTVAGGKVTLSNIAVSGSYRLVVATAGNINKSCVKTSPAAVVNIKPLPANISITVNPNKTTFCKGEAHVLTATATAGSTFQWKYDGAGTAATTNGLTTVGLHKYKVIATLNSCVDSSAITNITVNDLPDSSITQVGPFCSDDAAVNLTAATGGGTWKVDASTLAGNSFDPKAYSDGSHQIHYNVTVNGCSSHDTVTVQINKRKNATITSVSPMCGNAATVTLAGTDAGGTWSGTGITNTTTGVFDPKVSGAGTFTITYAITGTCGDSKTTSITVNATDSAKILPAGPFCSVDPDYTMKLTAGSTTGGTWSGTGVSAGGVFSPSTGNGTYSLTYTTSGSCPESDNISVTVSNSVVLNITSTKDTYCHNANKDTIEVTALGGKFSTWSGKGIVDADFGYYDPKLANIGNDTIWYMKAGSCGDTTFKVITVTDIDTAKITTPQGPFCQSQGVVTLQKETISDAGAWSGTGITNGSTGAFDPSVGAGAYLIAYKTSGACPVQDTTTIRVVGQMIANIVTSDTTMCKNASAKQIRLSSNSTGGGTWLSAPTAGLVTNTGLFDPTTAGVGVFKIYYAMPGATLGCSAADSVLITVSAIDTAKISTGQGPFCLNDPVQTLKVESASSAGTWSGTGITNAATGSFSPTTAGVGAKLVTYKTSGSCWVQDTMTMYVVNQMVANITNTTASVCEDAGLYTIQKSGNTTPGGTWTSVPAGVVNSAGQFDASQGSAGSTYRVYYSLSGATATCSAQDSIDITIVPREDATITSSKPQAMCVYDQPKQLTTQNSGGIWSGTGVNNNGLFTSPGPGTYKLYYSINGTSGLCPDKDSIVVVVLDTLNSSIQPVTSFCQNLPAQQLTPVKSGGTFSGIAVTSSGSFDPKKAPAGTYDISYTQGGACPTTGHVSVTIDSLPYLYVKQLTGGCVPYTVAFADSAGANVTSAQWIFGDGATATVSTSDASAMHPYTSAGTFYPQLFVEFANGCLDSASASVQIYEVPVADFSFDPMPANALDPNITFTNASAGSDNYRWDFGSTGLPTMSGNTNELVWFDAPNGDTIPVTLISYNAQCADTITKDVFIKGNFTLFVPTAFSPNGDGINDLFYPAGINHRCAVCDNYEFLIFNRWGELIFKSTTVDEPWNGKRSNTLRDAEVDVYVWKLIYTDSFTEKAESQIGKVTLMR